jgi:hypothetical protein
MTAVRSAWHAGGSSVWVARRTCKAVVEGFEFPRHALRPAHIPRGLWFCGSKLTTCSRERAIRLLTCQQIDARPSPRPTGGSGATGAQEIGEHNRGSLPRPARCRGSAAAGPGLALLLANAPGHCGGVDVDRAVLELYGLAPEEFTAARNALVKAAKDAGDHDERLVEGAAQADAGRLAGQPAGAHRARPGERVDRARRPTAPGGRTCPLTAHGYGN